MRRLAHAACGTGLFVVGGRRGQLRSRRRQGALAAFSPSGRSLNAAAHLCHEALLTQILSGRHARLADAILAAHSDYAATRAFPELLRIYNLLGDPAMRLRQTRGVPGV